MNQAHAAREQLIGRQVIKDWFGWCGDVTAVGGRKGAEWAGLLAGAGLERGVGTWAEL